MGTILGEVGERGERGKNVEGLQIGRFAGWKVGRLKKKQIPSGKAGIFDRFARDDSGRRGVWAGCSMGREAPGSSGREIEAGVVGTPLFFVSVANKGLTS